jgi:Smg protein
MFEVLVYIYENYWQGDACPESPQLSRKLIAAGFDADEIQAALIWLYGLNTAAQSTQIYLPQVDQASFASTPSTGEIQAQTQTQSAGSMRAYSIAEQEQIGRDALGFVSFLESSGVLPPQMREIVIDRAMAVPGSPVALDDLKIIVLMVYWSFGQEPDALVLDELCDDATYRIGH